jgi:hypothetical protein
LASSGKTIMPAAMVLPCMNTVYSMSGGPFSMGAVVHPVIFS